MSHHTRRLGVLVVATAVVAVVGLGTTGVASGKKKAKPLKVSCDQLYQEVRNTGSQLQAHYNAMGFTIGLPTSDVPDPDDPTGPPLYPGGPPIDGVVAGGACQKQGKRIREGNGFMIDIHSPGEPPFPGETNADIREYDWFWNEIVTRTKTGQLRDAVVNFRCEKYIYDGSYSDPHNVQTFSC
jgi:hypothetical protein